MSSVTVAVVYVVHIWDVCVCVHMCVMCVHAHVCRCVRVYTYVCVVHVCAV